MKFNPRPYQALALDFLNEHPRCNLWAGMGLGKTVTVLTLLDAVYNLAGETAPTLVLAPLRVAVSTWPDEVRKWDHLQNLKVVSITGDVQQRRAALNVPAHVYTMNYDNLVWLREQFKTTTWPFTRVVADESTRLKSFRLRQGGKRAQALGSVAHTQVTHWINLTGTPSPNGLQDLWGQQWFVDAGRRLGLSYSSFQERWFKPFKPKDSDFYKWAPTSRAAEEIKQRMADVTLSIDPADWFDLQAPIVNVIKVDLPRDARRHYEELEAEFFSEIEGQPVDALSAAARSMKLLQVANGAVYWHEREFVVSHDEKLDALESVVEEANGAPVLVAYHFKSDLARLQARFPHGRVLDKRPETIADWNAGRIPLLFAHPDSAGHGLNLQDGGNILVYFAHWWALESHDQILERIGPVRQLQAGHKRPVFVHYIVAADTIDVVVIERRVSKRSVQDDLLAYMKHKRSKHAKK